MGKTVFLKDEMIIELLELLKQNNMPKEANHTFELCAYIDSLEKKLDSMTEELTNVKQQLKNMQKDTVLNNIKTQVLAAEERIRERCNAMKEQLLVVKDNMRSKASEIVVEVKKKGKAALNKISELLSVKEKLVSVRELVKKSQKDVTTIITKIDAFGAGMREANQKIANTFRTFADREEVDYAQKERRFTKTEMVKKPWLAKQKLLEAMELRLDGAIDKTENLARDVEIDCMVKMFDEQMDKPHSKSEVKMVAESEYQYGADAFEVCKKAKSTRETVLEVKYTELKNDGKSR
ncbi:MAG: hypothetical protein GX963_12065 [Bacteroidales bacterium]|nr:hypothetical protein [Bacteroidales bacterium]